MLEKYDEKRNFDRTPEPLPKKRKDARGPLTFVIQKHAATRLHYDFRLELDGALKSWAVPKGPSLSPNDKHLAVMVDDHPLDYASFEGVIPKGEYGAGPVIVWDRGTYSPDEGGQLSFDDREQAEERMRRGLTEGKISLFLRGQKLKGSWTLVKIKKSDKDWLLIKHQDQFASDLDALANDRSVLSDVTLNDLKAGRKPQPVPQAARVHSPADLAGAAKAAFPSALPPMLPTLTERAFSHSDWLFEPKLDGVRALTFIREGKVTLSSRRGLDSTRQYPALAEELGRQPEGELILDGEIVALDAGGRPSFELLQKRMNLSRDADIRRAEARIPVVYYVFDLLYVAGHDLRGSPLEGRLALLENVLIPTERVRLLEPFPEDGEIAYEAAVELGLEGVIAKRRNSVYEAGKRSRSWLKVKSTLSEDFVIGGFSEGQGARARTFGAILVGSWQDDGRLVYAGHVGSGFDEPTLAALLTRLQALTTDEAPFTKLPPLKGRTTWVRPEIVAEVKFAQRTEEGYLRAPVFIRLREDKTPAETTPIEVAPAPAEALQLPNPSMEALIGEVESVLEQLERPGEKWLLDVEGHKIPLSNLDKELWPPVDGGKAITKRDLIRYLARVSSYLLPHLRDRPLTLIRFPNGIDGTRFYQRHHDDHRPPFVETVRLWSDHVVGDTEHMLCNNLATLLWLGQIADLEIHSWYSRVSQDPDAHHLPTEFTGSPETIDRSLLNYPDFIVFDLDPYIYSGLEAPGDEPELNRRAFAKTCEVALWLKEILDSLSVSTFVKTTGKTGLHLFVPILRNLDYDATRSLAETIGGFVLRAHPKDVTMDWAVKKRPGKVFIDHNQNVRSKTLASIYSPRAMPHAAVSMPLRWDELGKVYPTDFTILTGPDRLQEVGDLWAGILDAKADLHSLLEAVGEGQLPA